MTRYLNKRQVIELLDSLNVDHNGVNKYTDLKRLLFNEIPDYHGKKKFDSINTYIENQIIPERIQNIADDLDIFNNYEPPEQLQPLTPAALLIKDNIIKQVNSSNDFHVDFSNTDTKTEEAYFLALIQALKKMKLNIGSKYLKLRLRYGDGLEALLNINGRTVSHIQHLIDVLEGKCSDDVEDFTESDKAILMGLMSLQGFSFEWYDYKRLSKAFGYFPYYNTIPDLDLSMFGIFHNDEEADYTDNCFIFACIQSKLFSTDEIDFMRSIINTRYIPRDDVKYIAELMNVQIDTYYYNEKRKKIDKAVRFNKGKDKVLRLLIRCGHGMIYHDELVPPNKYDVHNLNTLITKMLENNELELIKDVSCAEKFMNYEFEFENLDYSSCSLKLFKDSVKKNIKFEKVVALVYDENKDTFQYVAKSKSFSMLSSMLFYKFNDKTLIYLPNLQNLVNVFNDNTSYKVKISQYRKTIQQIKLYSNEKTIYLRSFKSLTSIDTRRSCLRMSAASHETSAKLAEQVSSGHESASPSDVFEFTNLVKLIRAFMLRKLNLNLDDYSTLPKMALSAAFNYGCFGGVYALSGKVKEFAKRCIHGGLIRTLYDGCFEVEDVKCFDINSSYGTSMNQMPGIPKGMPKPFYKVIPSDACYAFIQINISNIRNDKLGRYSFINEGINFVDSILLDEIRKYVDCDIEIINGYYFYEGFNDKINDFAKLLYDIRTEEYMNKLGKNMLSSLYGKSLQSSSQFIIKLIPIDKLNEFLSDNGNFVYQMIKDPRSDIVKVQLLKSINYNFNIPQFGVQVLSESRRRMNEIINYCNNQDIPIYSIKTDSFVIPNDKVDKFEQKYKVGSGLGEVKCEYEANHIKYTSASCYKAELVDGSIRTRGKVE